jgi:endonuclease YncB( thermonuclease family)
MGNCCFANSLFEASLEATPFHSLSGISESCIVLDCYDGDTCIVALAHNKITRLYKCRLAGIDTPEMKGADKKNAMAARDFLIELITGVAISANATRREAQQHLYRHRKLVKIECGEWDKYGRLLVKLYASAKCINEALVQVGMAKKYDGGTKV